MHLQFIQTTVLNLYLWVSKLKRSLHSVNSNHELHHIIVVIHSINVLLLLFEVSFVTPKKCLPEATFSSEGEADRTLRGFGSQDKGSVQSGYFSTILSPHRWIRSLRHNPNPFSPR